MNVEITRGEFDMLRSQVSANQSRMDSIDDHGTRGVGALTTRMDEVVKDLAELKTEVAAKFAAHELLHEKEKQERRDARRWLVGIGLAGIATMGTVIGLLIEILSKVHGG